MELNLEQDFSKEDKKYLGTLSKKELNNIKQQLRVVSSSNNTAQENRKILINSVYGALGNNYFRFYDLRNATAVTLFGQMAIQWMARKVDEELNLILKTDQKYVSYIDTDSLYVDVENLVELAKERTTFETDNDLVDFLDNFCKTRMQDIMDKALVELYEYMNNYENMMSMDREVIAMPSLDSKGLGGFWTAKKRYALNVYDSEGTRFATPKLKILGLETQRSSTPAVLRDVLRESIRLMVQEGEDALHKQVEEFKEHYHTLHYTDIAKVTTANNLEKYSQGDTYISGTPGHVRGALLYNKLLRQNNLVGATPILEGSRVMEVTLKDVNPWQERTICWPSGLDITAELEDEIIQYMDYNKQFESTFIKPLDAMCKASGIKYEKVNSLSDMFNF